MLLAALRDKNPVIFLEPKSLYRASSALVPDEDYEIPLGKAEVIKEGKDITIVGYGYQLTFIEKAIQRAEAELKISCELIDLRTILPYDFETVSNSVKKTGRALIAHEAPKTSGFGAEISSQIQERCFLHLEAPVKRVCGYDTPFPHIYERVRFT